MAPTLTLLLALVPASAGAADLPGGWIDPFADAPARATPPAAPPATPVPYEPPAERESPPPGPAPSPAVRVEQEDDGPAPADKSTRRPLHPPRVQDDDAPAPEVGRTVAELALGGVTSTALTTAEVGMLIIGLFGENPALLAGGLGLTFASPALTAKVICGVGRNRSAYTGDCAAATAGAYLGAVVGLGVLMSGPGIGSDAGLAAYALLPAVGATIGWNAGKHRRRSHDADVALAPVSPAPTTGPTRLALTPLTPGAAALPATRMVPVLAMRF